MATKSKYGLKAKFKHDWTLDTGYEIKKGDEVGVDLIDDDPNTNWTLISVKVDGEHVGYAESEAPHTMLDFVNEAKKKKSIKEEEAGGPGPGAATVDNVIGNSADYQYLGRDAKERDLKPEEEDMLAMTDRLSDGGTKIAGYEDFKAKAIDNEYAPAKNVTEAINIHFGDFSQEAHNLIKKLPTIDGLLEIKSINEALSSKYKVSQIEKVIDAVRNK